MDSGGQDGTAGWVVSAPQSLGSPLGNHFEAGVMTGGWNHLEASFTHMAGACVGKIWRLELATGLPTGGFSMWLFQVAWLGAKYGSFRTLGFLT